VRLGATLHRMHAGPSTTSARSGRSAAHLPRVTAQNRIRPSFGCASAASARSCRSAHELGHKFEAVRPLFGCVARQDNRDKRVELLQRYARKFFPSTRYLDYALKVEAYTLTKAANLVMNVDVRHPCPPPLPSPLPRRARAGLRAQHRGSCLTCGAPHSWCPSPCCAGPLAGSTQHK